MAQNKNIIGVLSAVDSTAIHVRQERCAKVRNRNVQCLKCAAACTSGCISLVDDQLVIDASKCVGCGTCATVCPTCALEARNPTDAQLLETCKEARRGKEVVIVCEQARRALEGVLDESRVAQVVCLGRVEESLVCSLVAEGVSRVRLVCGRCEHCEQKLGLQTARMVADSATSLLSAWGSDAQVKVCEDAPAGVLLEGMSADEAIEAMDAYFSEERGNEPIRPDAADELADALGDERIEWQPEAPVDPGRYFVPLQTAPQVDDALVRVMKDGTLPHFIPDRRERMLDALAQIGEPTQKTIKSRLVGCVVINGGKCSSCRMCATFCPTGAIRKFDNQDGTFGVLHFPADCVKCGSCRDICKEQAIVLLDDVPANFMLQGTAHRYVMKEPAVQMGGSHQILNVMRARMPGTNIWER